MSEIESDVKRYRTLLPEYRRNPLVLLNRLWQETRERIFSYDGVRKFYRPEGIRELRLRIPLDPEEERRAKQRELEKKAKETEVEKLHPTKIKILGPKDE